MELVTIDTAFPADTLDVSAIGAGFSSRYDDIIVAVPAWAGSVVFDRGDERVLARGLTPAQIAALLSQHGYRAEVR